VLNLSQAIPDDPAAAKKTWPGIVVDNHAAETVGDWALSSVVSPYVGIDYLHDGNTGKGEKSVRFTPDLPADGEYEVRLAYTPGPNRSSETTILVHSADGPKTIKLDQKQPPADPPFVSLGRFRFQAGRSGYVELRNEGSNGHVVADAVQFLPVK